MINELISNNINRHLTGNESEDKKILEEIPYVIDHISKKREICLFSDDDIKKHFNLIALPVFWLDGVNYVCRTVRISKVLPTKIFDVSLDGCTYNLPEEYKNVMIDIIKKECIFNRIHSIRGMYLYGTNVDDKDDFVMMYVRGCTVQNKPENINIA